MTEIKVLDKSVFNRIAAGEVVERPASIAKELIENAIDAGATAITVQIKGGGIDFIRVSDNGCGIKANEVKTAFLPHATSKISNISDLDGISTLGFRGEALPSIASVAKVTMVSRPKNQEMAMRYVIDNGVEIDFGEIGATEGTSVTVEHLFDRIPARKKFLNKIASEENSITNLISRFILANPSISFKYSSADKIIFTSNGLGLENAIKCVYGDEYLSKMVKIDSALSDIVLYGYINKPSFSKHSRALQTLVVNGRFVENSEISYTVYGCFQKYLMSRQYPTFVLHLNVPYDMVDANVHPNKMEVKFAVPGLIKKLLSDTIKTHILSELSTPKEINIPESDFFTVQHKSDLPFDTDICITPSTKTQSQIEKDEPAQQDTFDEFNKAHDPFEINEHSLGEYFTAPKKVNSTVLEVPQTVKFPARNKYLSLSDSASENSTNIPSQIELSTPKTRKNVGKLFNTYIIVEQGNDILLIDQHAAHEKLLYDRYLREYESGIVATQSMLIPYEFTLTHEESEFLIQNIDKLASAGFTITQKSATKFQLKSIPLCCISINAQTFISDFISEQNGRFIPETFKHKLMQTACKSAIKGEDDLSQCEIDALLDAFDAETTEYFCPHGRPIVIKLTRREIEKCFKRIV